MMPFVTLITNFDLNDSHNKTLYDGFVCAWLKCTCTVILVKYDCYNSEVKMFCFCFEIVGKRPTELNEVKNINQSSFILKLQVS